MEIELKYLIEDEETQKKLWDPSVFGKYGEVDLHAETNMRAVYYDTEDGLLRSVDAAFRIRKENDRYVATLKWGGTSDEALHEREELNLPLCEKSDAEEPSLKVFAESEKGRELIELAGERKLIPTVETSFTRRTMRIDTGKTICEAALDTGKIITSGGNADIRELELELFSAPQAPPRPDRPEALGLRHLAGFGREIFSSSGNRIEIRKGDRTVSEKLVRAHKTADNGDRHPWGDFTTGQNQGIILNTMKKLREDK